MKLLLSEKIKDKKIEILKIIIILSTLLLIPVLYFLNPWPYFLVLILLVLTSHFFIMIRSIQLKKFRVYYKHKSFLFGWVILLVSTIYLIQYFLAEV